MPDPIDALIDALAGKHQHLIFGVQVRDVPEAAGLFGRTTRQQHPGLAAAMAGAEARRPPDQWEATGARKSSREYRRAIRAVQRYRAPAGRQQRGRIKGLRPDTGARITAAARYGMTRPYRAGVRVRIMGPVRVSDDCRPRPVVVILSAEEARPFLNAFTLGNYERASDLFQDAVARHYGVLGLTWEDCEDGEPEMDRIELEPVG